MKIKFTLILFAAIFIKLNSYADVIDTLREYDPTKVTTSYTNSITYPNQYVRYDLPAPGYLTAIILTLGGTDSTGSVTVHVFGHEGGVSFPELETDLITPLVFHKTVPRTEKVVVNLPSPVWLDNNQFFIKVTSFSSNNIRLLRDNITHAPSCSDVNGGYFYLSYASTRNDSAISPISSVFAIDCIMDYTEGTVSPQYMHDVTLAAGIDTNLSCNYISWGDFNNDHYPDLLVAGHLYKNMGNGTFTDITSSAGLASLTYIATFIDMNNDGKEDILCLGNNAIYINQGNETFVQQSLNLNLLPGVPISSYSIADINNDGYPDLFIGYLWTSSDTLGYYAEQYYNYQLYLNDGNLGFKDTSSVITPLWLPTFYAQFSYDTLGTTRCTRGAQFCDYNDDGKMDLYIANYRLQPDNLWNNNGNGTFTDTAYNLYIDHNNYGGSGHGTGVDWGDYNNDGFMDLLLPQLAHPTNTAEADDRPTTLYQNQGAPYFYFTDENPGVNAGPAGIEYEETHGGANWGDLNNDGLLDFAICAFYGCRYSDIYLQKPDHTFQLKTFDYGTTEVVGSPDLTLVDYDNDGKLDMACGYNQQYFRLFKNTNPAQNYVEIELASTSYNKQGLGAKVVIYAGGQQFTRYQMPYHGELMSDGSRMHFGIGAATKIDSAVVRWPNGTTMAETFTGLGINTWDILTEGGSVTIGVENLHTSTKVSLYPNPVSEMLTIAINNTNSENTGLLLHSGWQVEIMNVMGQTVQTNAVLSSSSITAVDVSGLTPGMYFVKISTKETNFVQPFVKD